MQRNRGARVVGGILLILVGVYLILIQINPDLSIFGAFEWPMIMIGIGALMLIIGLLLGEPGMAVPAAIVAGLGCIFLYQTKTDDWTSWAYIWALIPGFAGVGGIVAGLLGDNPLKSIREGITLVIISGILFVIFSSIFGGPVTLGDWWPVLLILLGFWILISYFLGTRRSKEPVETTPDDQL